MKVWTIFIGYSVIVIFWWKPASVNVLSKLSLPIWTLLFIYFVSYAGKWKALIFLVLLVLLIVGLFEEWKESSRRGRLCLLYIKRAWSILRYCFKGFSTSYEMLKKEKSRTIAVSLERVPLNGKNGESIIQHFNDLSDEKHRNAI